MIRFIWNNWWRRKERFILLLIGAFIVSAGLTYLIGLSEMNRGTVVDTLQQRWTASYDIVVRPEGTRSVTEEKKLLEPNYMSGLSGGISVEQYETIKSISGVEVAAPIAMIGYMSYPVNYGEVEYLEDGLYRRVETTTVNNGLEEMITTQNYHFPYGVWDYLDKGPEYGAGAPYLGLTVYPRPLLAGIDPVQEAKLVGLDRAILDLGSSRYFSDEDTYHLIPEHVGYHQFPVIVNYQAYVDKVDEIKFERLDIPITKENAFDVMDDVRDKGGESYLNTIEGKSVESYSYTGEEAFRKFVSEITGVEWETGELLEEDRLDVSEEQLGSIVNKQSPINYQEVKSPFPERWPYSYQVIPFQNKDEFSLAGYRGVETYREPRAMAEEFLDLPRTLPNWIGFYDPRLLELSLDPINELPMETYRPASAEFVMDGDGEPVNPPVQLLPTGDPYYFLSEPPGMLTTIEAAEQILGDEPISAIRIKVAGISGLGDESQEILERVAAEIEEQTGLLTDITLGSSPQLALTYIPAINEQETAGWIQQPWVNIGSAISLFRETKVGFSGIVWSVIVVAVVYVWSSGVVHLLARRKEFAVLLSIGWRPGQLNRLLLYEALLIGLFVAVVSWMMLGFVYMSSEATIPIGRFASTGIFGFLVYLFGSFVPMLLTRNISPYEAMRSGEITSRSKRVFQAKGIYRMAFNHFMGKWKRSILSVVTIALPTALLAVFLYITIRLQGIMYTSMLGEYVALEVGPVHYIAIVIALIIAILTTAEIMWQNVSERHEEIALLQAIGWRRWGIRRLILAEGFFAGLIAGLIGLTFAFIVMWGLYGELSFEGIGFITATGIIPVLIGVIGTILPAEKAVRITPGQGISGSFTNQKTTEKRLKWAIAVTAIGLVGTFLYTMIQVAPNIEQISSSANVEEAFSPTTGGVSVPDESDVNDTHEDVDITEYVDTSLTPGGYHLEFDSTQTSEDIGWGSMLKYRAEKVKSSLTDEPEPGMKFVAIEYYFEIVDVMSYDMQHNRHFSLLVEDESYRPINVNVIESEGWKENRTLSGQGAYMQAILEFQVPVEAEEYGFFYRDFRSTGQGFMIWFNE